jgi:tRNA(Ile)-lysidine synthase
LQLIKAHLKALAVPEPLTRDEIELVCRRFAPNSVHPASNTSTLVLAVSGGADSMAMMHIFADGTRGVAGVKLRIATVDHGLRAASSDEAKFVAAEAARLGLEHVTLDWLGPKPSSGIQAKARSVRYQLLGQYTLDQRTSHKHLMTAHTLEDQAETVLMRLARGSGVEGLSGIANDWCYQVASVPSEPPQLAASGTCVAPVFLHRPLLAISKSRLIATLQARGARWIEDPSNTNEAFERVRIRRALATLAEVGISPESIATAARRQRTVRTALVALLERVLNDRHLVRFDPLGFIELSANLWDWHDGQPVAIQERVLLALLPRVGGDAEPLSLKAVEDLNHAISRALSLNSPGFGHTLARTKIAREGIWINLCREEGRSPPTPVQLVPGGMVHWDNRIQVTLSESAPTAMELRWLGTEGVAQLRARSLVPDGVPLPALRTAPGLWTGDELHEVPGLAPHWEGRDAAKSALLRRFSGQTYRLEALGWIKDLQDWLIRAE